METLLCRRLELAHASGVDLVEGDPAVREHVAGCADCQEVLRTDTLIAEALLAGRQEAALPDRVRARIEAQIHARGTLHVGAPLWLAAAAVLAVALAPVVLDGRGTSGSAAPTPVQVRRAALEPGEPLSGIAQLVARHAGDPDPAPGSPLPAGAVLVSERLPEALAAQLLQSPDVSPVGWEGLPPFPGDQEDATLYVLDRERVSVDGALADVLSESGVVSVPYGPHQVTLAQRNGRLFVIVVSPSAPAGLPPI